MNVSIWQDSEDEVAWILSQPDDPKETIAAIKSYIDEIHRQLGEILVMKTRTDAEMERMKNVPGRRVEEARANLTASMRNLHSR